MTEKKRKKKHWIEEAIKDPGSFRAAAKRAHESTEEFAEKKQHASGKLGRRARLAETLLNLRKKRG